MAVVTYSRFQCIMGMQFVMRTPHAFYIARSAQQVSSPGMSLPEASGTHACSKFHRERGVNLVNFAVREKAKKGVYFNEDLREIVKKGLYFMCATTTDPLNEYFQSIQT